MRMLALKTWRDLLRHKGQFIGLALLITLGVSTFVGFVSGYLDLTGSVARATRELHFADFTTSVRDVPDGTVELVKRVGGVRDAEGRLVVDTGLELGRGEKATARIVGIPDEHTPRVNSLLIQRGSWPTPGDDEVLLHTKFANETGMHPGDQLVLKLGTQRRSVRVVGIAASAEYMYAVRQKGELPSPREFAVLFMRQGDVERLVGKVGTVNDIGVLVRSGQDPKRVASAVESVVGKASVLESVQRADQPSSFMIGEEISQLRVMAEFMPLLILAITAASMYITLSRLVASQRGEIGLAKALGYTDGQLLVHYLMFAAFIALAGAAAGIVLGDWLARVMAQQYVDLLGVPMLDHRVYPLVLAAAAFVGLLACVVASALPAWRAVRIAPAEAMRADPNVSLTATGVPLVERMLGPLMPRSFVLRIPLRNVFRARRRSLYTILGIAFALVLTVATQASFDSIARLLDEVPRMSERWDIMAGHEDPFGAERIAEVARWQGVRDAEGAFVVPAKLRVGGALHEGSVTAIAPGARFHGFDVESGRAPAAVLADGEVLLPTSIATKLGVSVGDAVSVKTPYRDDPISLRVGAVTNETLGAPVFVSLAVARQLVGSSTDQFNVLYVRADPARIASLKERLSDLPGSSTVLVKTEMIERIRDMMEFAYFYQALLLGFGAIMAFVVIYNTFTASVAERTREIATMRTIGESNFRLAVMLTIENLLLALVGVPLGIWLGMRASDALYASLSSEAYTLTASIRPGSIALIVFGILVVMLISEIPGARRIFRLDLAEATKVME